MNLIDKNDRLMKSLLSKPRTYYYYILLTKSVNMCYC